MFCYCLFTVLEIKTILVVSFIFLHKHKRMTREVLVVCVCVCVFCCCFLDTSAYMTCILNKPRERKKEGKIAYPPPPPQFFFFFSPVAYTHTHTHFKHKQQIEFHNNSIVIVSKLYFTLFISLSTNCSINNNQHNTGSQTGLICCPVMNHCK